MKCFSQLFPILLASLLLGACGDDVVLPPAEPLATTRENILQLYGAEPGSLQVTEIRDLLLPGLEGGRDLRLNLYFPSRGSGFPLLLFSHGNWSDRNSYDRLLTYWASHGYAVIATDHLDCCGAVSGIFNSLRYGQLGLVEARVADLSRLIENLPGIERLAPEFSDKADASMLAIAGHSFGAFSAQQLGGARVFDPDGQRYISHRNPAVRAVVALSPPGPMFDTITAGSWTKLETPTLVSTGTWDVQPRFWPDWRMHLMSWETAVPGNKYALVTQGADHYLGNLICRPEREATPQEDALLMMKIASTAFLDAYVKQKSAAKAFLTSGELARVTAGFSELLSR